VKHKENENEPVLRKDQPEGADQHRSGRRSWVVPKVERMDLRDAMSGGFDTADGATSS